MVLHINPYFHYFSSLTEILKFVATIVKQGDMRVIIIPKKLHPKISKRDGDQVKITIEEI
jgi:hypothetical protein